MTDSTPIRIPQALPAEERATGGAAVKRAIDLAGACGGLVLLTPVLALIAAAVKLDSPGPVLFRQRRIGLDGKPFTMLKFRTMREGSDCAAHRDYVRRYIGDGRAELQNASGRYKLEGDARVTRVGAILRKASLDELPQLLNVVLGEMSLVGPRPPLAYEVELYTPRHARRLEVMPGMTGLWQVSGRNETTFEEMVDLDLAYIEQWSPLLDLRIIARTVGVIAAGKGA